MIDFKAPVSDVFKEAKGRIDGLVMLISLFLSMILPIAIAILRYFLIGSLSINWVNFFAPLMIFLSYIRIRQSSFRERKYTRIFNAVLVAIFSVMWIYFLNFKKGWI